MKTSHLLLSSSLVFAAASAQADVTFNFGADAESQTGSVDYARRDAVVDGPLLTTGGPLTASAGSAQASVTAQADPATGMFKALTRVQTSGGEANNTAQSYARLDVLDTLRFSGPGAQVDATFSLSFDTAISGFGFDPFARTDQASHFMQVDSTRSINISYITPDPTYDPSAQCTFDGDGMFCPPGSNPFIRHNASAGKELFGSMDLDYGDGSTTYTNGSADNGHYSGTVTLSLTLPTNVNISLSYFAINSARCFNLMSCSLTVDASHSDYLGISVANGGSFVSENGYQYLGIPAAVPEPQTWALMAAGLGLVGFGARRRRAG